MTNRTASPETASQRIAGNARAIRARKQVKHETLARRSRELGPEYAISERKVYRLLGGDQKWSAEDIEAIAHGLGVEWSELTAVAVAEQVPA